MVSYLSHNVYKIYFYKAGKIKYLKNIIFMQNDKLLGTSLTENYNFFYYSKFNLKNTIFITDKNIF